MQIDELILLTEARLRQQADMRAEYSRTGDVASLIKIEAEILETEKTLAKLKA